MKFNRDFDWENHRTPSRQMRNFIIKRDGNVCQYCCRLIERERITVDHVIPFSRGGKTVLENLVVACKRCNQRKGNLLPHEANMILIPQIMGLL